MNATVRGLHVREAGGCLTIFGGSSSSLLFMPYGFYVGGWAPSKVNQVTISRTLPGALALGLS